VLVSHDWHLVELVADRLWLVEGGTVRPFDDDLEGYRRRLLSREETVSGGARGNGAATGGEQRRAGRRDAADRRASLQPLRRTARQAEAAAARLAAEQQALDHRLAMPGAFDGSGAELADALKRRAELARLIAAAEAEWVAAETAIEELERPGAGR
jgi:ATP-binding cassette subfamily F protein 3